MEKKQSTAPDWWERDKTAERWQLYEYCKKTIPDFESKEKATLAIIEERSCGLSSANWELYAEMTNAIAKYCEEHNLVNDYETDLVFWEE